MTEYSGEETQVKNRLGFTYVKLFGVLCLKILLLIAFVPTGSFPVTGQGIINLLNPTSWIYEKSVQEFMLQNVFYLEVAEGAVGEQIFADLQKQGVVEEYTQPFAELDIPYYRVQFSVREDVAKRTIALLLRNGKLNTFEGVPRFEIQQFHTQQTFHYGNKLTPKGGTSIEPPRKQLNSKPLRFTTQQVGQPAFEWQWYLDEIGLIKDKLLCLTNERPKVKVAIIDNAFMSAHPSFGPSIYTTIDVADGDNSVTPPFQDEERMHGTHSAGLIAGRKYADGQGIIGTSLGSAELFLLKGTTDSAEPNEITHGIEAFAKAIELDVDIISLSRGAYVDFPIFRKVIQKALDKGIIIIAAAGNYGSEDPFYPAAYDQVISVGSFDKKLLRSNFSNYGSRVDIYAPGEQLVVPDGKDGFAKTDGTSVSAPLFAGVYAALIRSFEPSTVTEPMYMRREGDMNFLTLDNLCADLLIQEPIQQATGIIQQIKQPIQVEHPSAPTVQQVTQVQQVQVQQIQQPTLLEELLLFIRIWLGWIVASGIIVVVLVVWFTNKSRPLPQDKI